MLLFSDIPRCIMCIDETSWVFNTVPTVPICKNISASYRDEAFDSMYHTFHDLRQGFLEALALNGAIIWHLIMANFALVIPVYIL